MGEKLTYRDFLVYSLNGFIALLLIGFAYRYEIYSCLGYEIKHEGILFLLLVPCSYVFGHVILGVDAIVFNQILYKRITDKRRRAMLKNKFGKITHCLFFQYRIGGMKDKIVIEGDEKCFDDTCIRMREKGLYQYAERFEIWSDMFKGFLIADIVVLIVTGIIKSDWIYFFMNIVLLFVFYMRARFSSENYVKEVEKHMKYFKTNKNL
jgi:hypothetical protein